MPYMNKVFLTGHITGEPEHKITSNGKPVTNFTLAVNRNYGDKTDFIKIVCWNMGNYKLAEYVAEDRLPKGKLVTVKGELHIDKYEDKWYTKVKAGKVIYEKEKADNTSEIEEEFDTPF